LNRSHQDFAAVIFDMDGVIVDSEPRHERAFLEVVRELGYADNLGMRFADYIGRSDKELWVDFVAKHNPAHCLDDLLAMKRRRVVELIGRERPLFRDLPELVERLAARCPLALASGSERPVIDAVLALGLTAYFPVVVSGSEVANGKPAPDIFLRAAELLQVAPRDCWVIEDSKPGVAAALAAGMRVVAITNTHRSEELRQATFVVSGYKQIEELLLGGRAKG
jgi:HAD superfamily hydrolase (TIGR01509 family)